MSNARIEQITKMGADAPIPPDTMNPAAPGGTPPRRFGCSLNEQFTKNALPGKTLTTQPSDYRKGAGTQILILI